MATDEYGIPSVRGEGLSLWYPLQENSQTEYNMLALQQAGGVEM